MITLLNSFGSGAQVRRFYFSSSTAAPVTPAVDADWGVSSGVFRKLKTVPALTGGSGSVQTAETSATQIDVMNGSFTSDSDVLPLGPIAGTFSLVMAMSESGIGQADMMQQVRIHVFDSTGTVKRGTIYDGQTATTVSSTPSDPNAELDFSLTTTRILVNVPLVAGTTVQSGDRLVVEHGVRACNTSTTSRNGTSGFRDDNLADHTLAAGSNSNLLPWIEFTLTAGSVSDPNTFLTGNRFWVSAGSITPQADNSQLTTTWQDQSGNGNHLTAVAGSGGAKPLYRTAASAGGKPAVQFQSGSADAVGGRFSIPDAVFTGLTSASAWAIVKSSQARTTLWQLGPQPGGNDGHFPYDDVIYEDAFASTRGTYVGTFVGGLDQWRNYIATQTAGAGTQTAYRDNTLLNTASRTFTLPGAGAAKLGGGPNYNFAGYVAAAGICDHVMTSGERAALLAWGATL